MPRWRGVGSDDKMDHPMSVPMRLKSWQPDRRIFSSPCRIRFAFRSCAPLNYADPSVEDQGRYLLEGVAAERRKLHRGVYRCIGRRQAVTGARNSKAIVGLAYTLRSTTKREC